MPTLILNSGGACVARRTRCCNENRQEFRSSGLPDVADANRKPMIAIRPFGGMVESPPDLVERVAEHIEWNEREMVDSLKRQARHEDTARWETIEFTLD